MLNLGQLTSTIQKNCHISDAQFAGDYTLCIFLLKMREFYRWENDIPLLGALPREDVGRWMQERERMWETLESSNFEPLSVDGETVDPFDSGAINQALLPLGLVYSAGYGRFGKPHFFLGRLTEARRQNDFTVYVSSCEYARDLVAPPAMMLNDVVYVRQESLRRYLWERYEEWRLHPAEGAMARAVAAYGFDDNVENALDRMTVAETESVILHEVGEARAESLLGPEWSSMLAALARTKSEIMVRAVRDLLADCLATLPGLLERDRPEAIHFYFASLTDLRRHLFPEAMNAYRRWLEGDHDAIFDLATAGHEHWLGVARRLLELHREHGAAAGAQIEQMLEHPPTCQVPVTH